MIVALSFIHCGRIEGQDAERKRQFQETDAQLRQVAEAAERGDVERAAAIFEQMPHRFLPSLPLPLENRSEERLANEVHRLTNELEAELAGPRRAPVVLRLAREVLTLLPRAAEAMGVPYSS
jgi:hypothetical protein